MKNRYMPDCLVIVGLVVIAIIDVVLAIWMAIYYYCGGDVWRW